MRITVRRASKTQIQQHLRAMRKLYAPRDWSEYDKPTISKNFRTRLVRLPALLRKQGE